MACFRFGVCWLQVRDDVDQERLQTVTIGVGVIAVAPLAWWLMGSVERLSSNLGPTDDPDYFMPTLTMSSGERNLIGAASQIVVVIAAALLLSGVRSGRLTASWHGVIAPAAGVAAYAGAGYAAPPR